MSNAVTIDIKGNNKNLKGALNDTESILSGFGKKMVGVFAAVGAAIAVKQVFDFGSQLVSMFAESEAASDKLGSVIRATGGAAGFTKEQLVGLSEELQNTTKFEAETTQGAMSILATFRNIRGDVFIDATKAIQDMSTVLGTDASGAAIQLGKALNDPVAGISALTRAGVTFTTSQEEMINKLVKTGDVVGAQKIILEELRNEFGGAAEDAGQTASGKLEQLKNRLGDIGESLGGALFDILDASMPIIDGVIVAIENMMPAIEETIKGFYLLGEGMFNGTQPVFEWFVDAGLTIFTGIEWAMSNFGKLWDKTFLMGMLAAESFVQDTIHLFTEVLPQYLGWFGENWLDIMRDIGDFEASILRNMANNVWEFIKGVKGYLTGSGEGFQFTALLDGFEMTTKKLPEIAGRVSNELENSLKKQIDKIDNELMDDFGNKFNDNKKGLESLFTKEERKKTDLRNKANFDFKPEDFTTKDDKKDKKDKKEKEDKGNDSLGSLVGLEELNKRIQEAALKGDPKKEEKEANVLAKEGNALLADLARAAGVRPGGPKTKDEIAAEKWVNGMVDRARKEQLEAGKQVNELVENAKKQGAKQAKEDNELVDFINKSVDAVKRKNAADIVAAQGGNVNFAIFPGAEKHVNNDITHAVGGTQQTNELLRQTNANIAAMIEQNKTSQTTNETIASASKETAGKIDSVGRLYN